MVVEQIEKVNSISYVFPWIIPLIATTIGLVILYWHNQTKRLVKYGNRIPGPPTLPIIGNAHYVIGKSHNGNLIITEINRHIIYLIVFFLKYLYRNNGDGLEIRKSI